MASRRPGIWGARYTSGVTLAALLHVSVPAVAQVVELPPVVTPTVSSPSAPPPTGVTADPYRVYGDDAPVFAALGVIGALGLKFNASLVTEYSNNVSRTSGEDVAPRFRTRDDWIFRPQIGASFSRPIGRHKVFLTASLGKTYYAENTMMNASRYSFSGGGNFSIGTRCGMGTRLGYSNRDTQFGTFEEVIPSSQERVTFGLNGTCRTPGGLTANMGYMHSKSLNHTHDPLNEIDRSFANVESNSVNGSIGYAVGMRGQVGIQGFWNQHTFPNQLLATGGVNENEVIGGSVFASYRVGTAFAASGSIGKTKLQTSIPGTTPFSGTTWNLGLTYSGPKFGANAAAGRNVSGGSGGSANYSVGTFFNASVNYALNRRMNTAAGFSTTDSTFRGFDPLPETEVVSTSKTNRFFIGANYSMQRIFSFSLDFNHQRRSSEPSSYNYKDSSVIFGIRARF